MSAPFAGMPIVESPFVPPGEIFVVGSSLFVSPYGIRRSWWWKPWTWRRKNVPPAIVRIRAVGSQEATDG